MAASSSIQNSQRPSTVRGDGREDKPMLVSGNTKGGRASVRVSSTRRKSTKVKVTKAAVGNNKVQ